MKITGMFMVSKLNIVTLRDYELTKADVKYLIVF